MRWPGDVTRRLGRALLLLVAAGLLGAACSGPEPLAGTVLTASDPATPFKLTDQSGRPVSLADYRGKVVALTFLYTYCPDICPIVTSHLKQARETLSEDSSEAAFVAISVDPERDTVERAHAYSQEWGMLDGWAFLVGDRERLAPIWKAYYVEATIDSSAHSDASVADHATTATSSSAASLSGDIATAYTLSHPAPVYLIDRGGLLRVLFTLPFDPGDLVHDIRLLLRE